MTPESRKHESLIISRQNHENYEIHRISRWNQENHENLIIPFQNHENHEIPNIESESQTLLKFNYSTPESRNS